jgi:hypothetical protein
MAIEGGVFTNLNKRNGYSFPPFIILTTMSLKLSQNKGKIVCLSIQNKGKLFHYTHIHITFKIRRTHKKIGANL